MSLLRLSSIDLKNDRGEKFFLTKNGNTHMWYTDLLQCFTRCGYSTILCQDNLYVPYIHQDIRDQIQRANYGMEPRSLDNERTFTFYKKELEDWTNKCGVVLDALKASLEEERLQFSVWMVSVT